MAQRLPENFTINCDVNEPASAWFTSKVQALMEAEEPAYVFAFIEEDTQTSLVVPELINEFGLKLMLSTKFHNSLEEGYETDELYRGEGLLIKVKYSSRMIYDAKDYKGAVNVSAVTSDASIQKTIEDVFDRIKSAKPEPEISRCWALVQNRHDMGLSPLDLTNASFVADNYIPKVGEQRTRIVESLTSDKPAGRVTILTGPPGTGKTHFIQSLLPEKGVNDIKFVYLPAHLAGNLDTPNLLKFMLSHKETKLIFIIEDCDSLVTPRAMDNVNTLSTFLNLTDGILGSTLDLHFIVSTNEKKAKFDPAITRPGRLLEIVEIENLPVELANKIYFRILAEDNTLVDTSEKIFSKPVTLAEVYARARGASIFESKERPIGLR